MIAARNKQDEPQKPLQPWRCSNCGSKLAEIKLTSGAIVAIKCSRCNAMNVREAA